MASEQRHVMMFPWLAFGHMLPFLEFSKQLAAKGIQESFVSTPRNLQRLPPIPSNLAEKLKFVEISQPYVDGLPENCEATIDVQLEEVQLLKKAYDLLQEPFEKIVENETPDVILFDFVSYWVPEVAAKFNVCSAFFSVFGAAVLAFFGPPMELKTCRQRTKPEDFMVAPNWFPFPSLIAHRLDQAAVLLRNLRIPDKSGLSSGQRWSSTLQNCDFVAVRSCREFEEAYLNLLEELYQKPVLPVGLLPPKLAQSQTHHCLDSIEPSTFKWLDKQEQKSVLFVGFGREYKMLIKQIHELAYGLEISGVPFIWILRKPSGIEDSDILPSGFLARTLDRGIVSLSWVPQVEILAHPAIGGCLFHSGGTIIESLGFGHPQILMPMMADQGLNAKLLAEKGLGFEVLRKEDGSFSREEVAKSIRSVIVEKDGESLRTKAAQVRTIFANQDLHEDYIEKFIHNLAKFKKKEHQIIIRDAKEV